MKILEIEVKNFRSIENAQLSDLCNFNILIGKNNSGKSSVLGILNFLNRCFSGNYFQPDIDLTAGDESKILEIRLVVTPSELEREQFIRDITIANRSAHLMSSSFYKKIEFLFKSDAERRRLLLHHISVKGQQG